MLTRDSILWWIAIVAALLTYLIADGRPPTAWQYLDWLKFLAAVIGTVSGKLANSPLGSSKDANVVNTSGR